MENLNGRQYKSKVRKKITMRKMKRMFALILAVAMLISMNITAFAAEFTQEAGDFSLDGIVVTVTHDMRKMSPMSHTA